VKPFRAISRQFLLPAVLCLVASCSTAPSTPVDALAVLPADEEFCVAAQRIVTRTGIPVRLERQTDFNGFVKSKALIEGPTIQQYEWRDEQGRLLAVSCKLKSADHLLAEFGPGTAGPDGQCQDMNRAIYALVARQVPNPAIRRVVFDPVENVVNDKEPGMTGPDWLAPYTMTSTAEDGSLRIAAKGFIVNFTDPRFTAMPERFRGVHYCHFVAPSHLRDLLSGTATPGAVIGRLVAPAPPPDASGGTAR